MSGRSALSWFSLICFCLSGSWVIAQEPGLPVPSIPEPPGLPAVPSRINVNYQPPASPNPAPVDPLREAPINPPNTQPLEPELVLPGGGRVALPSSVRQQIRFSPRYGVGINAQRESIGEDTDRWVMTGGVIVNVVYLPNGPNTQPEEVELATDAAVAWVKNAKGANVVQGLNTEGKTEVELYLTGNVVIRRMVPQGFNGQPMDEIFRAREIYYDVNKSRAVALDADLELKTPQLPDSVHLKADEMWQLGKNEFRAFESDVYSSKRPTSPGLRFSSHESTFTRSMGPRRNIFGMPYRDLLTGRVIEAPEQTLASQRVRLKIFDTPVFFLPRVETDVNEPIGPLTGFGGGQNRIFGFQTYFTWDMFKLLALKGPPSHRWVLFTDYLNLRGPGFGTEYDYNGRDLFGLSQRWGPEWNQPFSGLARVYGLWDKGSDILGGDEDRIPVPSKPRTRGRLQWRQNGDLYENGTTYLRMMAQVQYLSDPNFIEQFYKFEFDAQPNQESFVYLPGASGNWYGSTLIQPNTSRPWVTEAEALPRFDGHIIGQSFFDLFTYSAHANAGYYRFRPADPRLTPAPVSLTDGPDVDAARVGINQRLGLPFDFGALRIEPYGVADLAYYSEDLTGDDRGRFFGGGGARASLSLSRLYSEASSELFNVQGLNHKVTYGANYFAGYSDTRYSQLPQIDRLNDDATDLADRTARNAFRRGRPFMRPDGTLGSNPLISPAVDQALGFSPIFDPQQLAIRRLTPGRSDTLDSIQALQLDIRQRLQTKRGFPGAEHIVDWFSFDLAMSVFPDKDRDNFGRSTGQYMYNSIWHIGDRFSLTSSGWYEPFENGPKYINFGGFFNRPDGTNFYLGYRHMDPVDSRALMAVMSYRLSQKYSINLIGTYDFGVNQALSNQISIARTGTDVTVLFGLSYNALINNFGVQFAILPNFASFGAAQFAQGFAGAGSAMGIR